MSHQQNKKSLQTSGKGKRRLTFKRRSRKSKKSGKAEDEEGPITQAEDEEGPETQAEDEEGPIPQAEDEEDITQEDPLPDIEVVIPAKAKDNKQNGDDDEDTDDEDMGYESDFDESYEEQSYKENEALIKFYGQNDD